MTVSVAVTGGTGRMGGLILEAARDRDDVVVAFAASRSGDGVTTVAGVPVEPADDLPALLAEHDPDAVIDFTAAEASLGHVAAAADAGTPVVIGTTGFDDAGFGELEAASDRIPVLKAAPFNRGVPALLDAVDVLVDALPEWDIEVTGTHHNDKIDAPSGTTRAILRRIAAAGGPTEHVHGRVGESRRDPNEIGVHDRSAGDIRGEHQVLLAGDHQVLTITHRLESRRVYADAALDAAIWLSDREPGWYDYTDVPG